MPVQPRKADCSAAADRVLGSAGGGGGVGDGGGRYCSSTTTFWARVFALSKRATRDAGRFTRQLLRVGSSVSSTVVDEEVLLPASEAMVLMRSSMGSEVLGGRGHLMKGRVRDEGLRHMCRYQKIFIVKCSGALGPTPQEEMFRRSRGVLHYPRLLVSPEASIKY